MSAVLRSDAPKTLALPKTAESVRGAGESATGAFEASEIARVFVPENLRELGASAFRGTGLRNITFQADSRLEAVGARCFCSSELRAFSAPPGLRRIEDRAF